MVNRELLAILFLFWIFFTPACLVHPEIEPESFRIQKFWDESINYAFHHQVAANSCGPASVQMVLDFFNIDPLPSQEELAFEMNTTIYEYTYTNYVSQPFKNRNFTLIFNGQFDSDFSDALDQLKRNMSLNRPAILLMWYDTRNETGHYRVATGYNQTGLFFHDPVEPEYGYLYAGPNIFLNNSMVEKLWAKYDSWALILQSGPRYSPHPSRDFTTWIVLLFFVAMIPSIVVLSYILARSHTSGLR